MVRCWIRLPRLPNMCCWWRRCGGTRGAWFTGLVAMVPPIVRPRAPNEDGPGGCEEGGLARGIGAVDTVDTVIGEGSATLLLPMLVCWLVVEPSD